MAIKKREIYKKLRSQGLTFQQIADIYGVSKQAVESSVNYERVKKYSVYPNIDRFLHENRMLVSGFVSILEGKKVLSVDSICQKWRRILNGKAYPKKNDIDKLIYVTGLSYSELFMEDSK